MLDTAPGIEDPDGTSTGKKKNPGPTRACVPVRDTDSEQDKSIRRRAAMRRKTSREGG